jgi:hypothetical protein
VTDIYPFRIPGFLWTLRAAQEGRRRSRQRMLLCWCVSGGQACSTFRALRVVFARRSFVFAFDNKASFRVLSCAVRTYHVYAHRLAWEARRRRCVCGARERLLVDALASLLRARVWKRLHLFVARSAFALHARMCAARPCFANLSAHWDYVNDSP